TVYPNPTKGEFNIDLEELNGQTYDYRVLDPLGRVIKFQKNEYKSNVAVQLKSPSSGIYFVEVTIIQSQQKLIKKLLIE
ncbi:MAG TPA: T9SS type A sorting domain-containing protein, partial [Brumimicrobium sp.]|nr:T9SS type A sorting domain-containing protein [Brumimicrobium sp.]